MGVSSRRWGRMLAASLTGLAIVAWGCGGGTPDNVTGSLTEAKVKGKVFVKGEPATKGEVVFDPSNVNRKMEFARTAPINPDGTYEITTLIGDNKVSARGPGLQAFVYQIQFFNVKEGENTFDIQLPAPQAAQ